MMLYPSYFVACLFWLCFAGHLLALSTGVVPADALRVAIAAVFFVIAVIASFGPGRRYP